MQSKPFYISWTLGTNAVFVVLAVLGGLFCSQGFFDALVAAMQNAGMNVDMGALTLVITFLVSIINIALRFKTNVGVALKK